MKILKVQGGYFIPEDAEPECPTERSKFYELTKRKEITKSVNGYTEKARDIIWKLKYSRKLAGYNQAELKTERVIENIIDAMFELLIATEQLKSYIKHDTNWNIDDNPEVKVKKLYGREA